MNHEIQNYTPYIEEDEIDLKELWHTILQGKKIIALSVIITVTLTFIYVLKIPNTYTAKAVLIPTESKGSSLGGLGGLAAMAGVSLGGGSMTPDIAFNSLLEDKAFMKEFIIKNKLDQYYTQENLDKNYIFALGFRGIYDFFQTKKEQENKEQIIYNLIQKIKSSFSITADKKSGLISVSYSDYDRFITPKIVSLFLKDASYYLVQNNLKNIDSRLQYFQKEMATTEAFEIRQNLSEIISQIVKEKIMMKSKKYYQCDLLTPPTIPYIQDKVKPKRGLILVVSFITSLILGVFLVFFLNFIKGENNVTNKP